MVGWFEYMMISPLMLVFFQNHSVLSIVGQGGWKG